MNELEKERGERGEWREENKEAALGRARARRMIAELSPRDAA